MAFPQSLFQAVYFSCATSAAPSWDSWWLQAAWEQRFAKRRVWRALCTRHVHAVVLAWLAGKAPTLGQLMPAIHGDSTQTKGSVLLSISSSSFPHRLEHLNHTFHFWPPATGMSCPPGASREAKHTLTKHAVLSTQCIVEDVQPADAESRGQKRQWTSLLRHTLLLLQRQAASGQSARRYRAAGCPHLEQGWPQGS